MGTFGRGRLASNCVMILLEERHETLDGLFHPGQLLQDQGVPIFATMNVVRGVLPC